VGGNFFKNWTNEMVAEFNQRKLKARLLSAGNEAKILTETSKHYPTPLKPSDFDGFFPEAKKKRIRQSSKPLMNKLESQWYEQLKMVFPQEINRIRVQAFRVKLASGTWYKPDFFLMRDPGVTVNYDFPSKDRVIAWEVKGPHAFRGGKEFLKIAAYQYPEIKFVLVWKENGQWVTQEILA
jgi:hypothetical protein